MVLAQHDGGYAGSSNKKKPRFGGAQVYGLYVVYGLYGTLRNDFGVFRSGTIPGAGIGSTKTKRAAGVVGFRRLVLAHRGLTGLLSPYAKSGTRLFQPYFMNCFNCASPAVPIHQ